MREVQVTIADVLRSRELRRDRQKQLLQQYQRPVLCLTMNIAGSVKLTPLVALAFDAGADWVERTFACVVHQEKGYHATGPEAYFVLDAPAQSVKTRCCEAEESGVVGRLYDLDVIDVNGEKLSRGSPRTCLVCGGPVFLCARNRAHGLGAIRERTEEILRDFAASRLADLAVKALKDEANLTPKPGLVDGNNSGAHRDMDLSLFLQSAESLRPYFEGAVGLGMACGDCMEPLQRLGLDAERRMFSLTNGVNTHKGAIYSFGLLLAALGSCLVREDDLFQRVSALAKSGAPAAQTHGALVTARYRARGARQEAELGMPSVREALRRMEDNGNDPIATLMEILLFCEDTNVLYRGGREGLDLVRAWAKKVLQAPASQREELLLEMDAVLIRENLSPGGCADILAQTLFLNRLAYGSPWLLR